MKLRILSTALPLSALLGGVCLTNVAVTAEEPRVTAADLPRTKPFEKQRAISTFQVRPGFRLELAAAEPEVVDPIAICFDESGRLFVIEMRDYSERRDERLGRVRLLEDRDADGRFETSSVFADGFPWPTALLYFDGGLFVGTTPDLFYLKDRNGNGRIEPAEKELVFTGFAEGKDRINVQAMLNSLHWTLDGRIHGATGPNGGLVRAVNNPAVQPLNLNGRDFSFDPRTRELRAEFGGGQHGLTFDRHGRKFVCSNSHHLQALMYELRYAGASPFYSMPDPLVDIAVDGPAAEVFRISPNEPWRILRTQWRVQGTVSGPIEGGGRVSGYFTGATGATLYRGDAYPPEFLDNAFIGDAGGNLVHRKIIRRDGLSFLAHRAGDEQNREFIASTDTWFRPVQFANAPDGCLYVIDMYREVIEHPWSIPPAIKQHLDLNSGNDRGRIYRVVPERGAVRRSVNLKAASTEELVNLLSHANAWHRETASRLLFERQDPRTARLLDSAFHKKPRLEHLHALARQGQLTEQLLRIGLQETDPALRWHSIRLAERFMTNGARLSQELRRSLAQRASDPVLEVRYQLAHSLSQAAPEVRKELLPMVAAKETGDVWLQAALLNACGSDPAILLRPLIGTRPLGDPLVMGLLEMAGVKNSSVELKEWSDQLLASSSKEKLVAFSALSRGLKKGGHSGRELLSDPWQKLAGETAGNSSESENLRLAALDALKLGEAVMSAPIFASLAMRSQEPVALQLAAAAGLMQLGDTNRVRPLFDSWTNLSLAVQRQVLNLSLNRPETARLLLDQVEQGTVRAGSLSPSQVQRLRTHGNPAVKQQALKVLGPATREGRSQVAARYAPALNLPGVKSRGELLFQERCASCHRFREMGYPLGPDLASVQASGKEMMLANLVDPNREVAPQYLAHQVETTDGELVVGLLAAQNETGFTIKQAGGVEKQLLKSQVKKSEATKQSLMPEGLEEGLNLQQMADLLEYLGN